MNLWKNALTDLYLCGFITEPQEICEGVFSATHTGHGYAACAAELATTLPGQLWPGGAGISWVNGKLSGRLIDPDDKDDLEASQKVLEVLGVDCFMPWSRGRIARALMSWAVDPMTCQSETAYLCEGFTYGYHDCTPGEYRSTGESYCRDNATHLFDEPIGYPNPGYKPGAIMYDAKAYYYTLLCRCVSPRIRVGKRIYFDRLLPDENARWKAMLAAVNEDKVLRNSLVGCAMGSAAPIACYTQDRERPGKSKRRIIRTGGGPFKSLGHLIIRSAAELNCLASWQVDSVYSTIDSVVSVCGSKPTVWEDFGVTVRQEASGDALIKGRGVWRVGHRATNTYKAMAKDGTLATYQSIPADRMLPPNRLYHREWLS